MIAAPTAASADNGNDHSTAGNSGTSGVVTEPQPRSNADNNGTGANTSGPYDSTRDGSASENGNGDGNATGKPCAGCVGRADNKNPAGQLPNAVEDGNNGYECDGNSGIAKTNPAHTGCESTSNPTSSPPSSGGVLGETLTRPAAVLGETVTRPATVLGETLTRPAAVLGETVTRPATVLGETVTAPVVAESLPRTGFDATSWATFAVLLIAAGGFSLANRRRLEGNRI